MNFPAAILSGGSPQSFLAFELCCVAFLRIFASSHALFERRLACVARCLLFTSRRLTSSRRTSECSPTQASRLIAQPAITRASFIRFLRLPRLARLCLFRSHFAPLTGVPLLLTADSSIPRSRLVQVGLRRLGARRRRTSSSISSRTCKRTTVSAFPFLR